MDTETAQTRTLSDSYPMGEGPRRGSLHVHMSVDRVSTSREELAVDATVTEIATRVDDGTGVRFDDGQGDVLGRLHTAYGVAATVATRRR